MRFKNRIDAGQRLAKKLDTYIHTQCVVYALPRGGVPLGVEIARYLHAPLDLVIPRKIGHPNWPEYAVCAVTESGHIVCNEDEVKQLDSQWLERAIEVEKDEAKRRRHVYRAGRRPIDPKGKVAIITDDGIATGLTMKVAVQELADKNPDRIVIAVPVAPSDIIDDLKKYVDEVIVLEHTAPFLGSIGAYYDEFDQMLDEEVVELLSTS
jgi:putative phosphoribosyl transferase